ncbi:MAG: hypothetical protein ABIP54_02235 [Candidatus Andersenbacteria bacterium]
MPNILAYKTAEDTISICTPADKAQVQRDLSAMMSDIPFSETPYTSKELSDFAKQAFINDHQAALDFETKRANTLAVENLAKRLDWIKSVQDFHAITDEEFNALVHCSTPNNHKYHHWIDDAMLPADRAYRDAWVDIDETGNVTHDLERARQIQLQRNLIAKQAVDQAALATQTMNADPIASKILNSLADLTGT